MKTSFDSPGSTNPVAIAVVVVLLSVSAGFYLLQIIGVPVLVALVVISLP